MGTTTTTQTQTGWKPPADAQQKIEEFRALFELSGFELTRIVPNRSPLSTIEARVKV